MTALDICIAIVLIIFIVTRTLKNDTTASSISTPVESSVLDNILGCVYEVYKELDALGYSNHMENITLFPMGGDGERAFIGVDVFLDGSFYLSRLSDVNDILTNTFEIIPGDDPETFHTRRTTVTIYRYPVRTDYKKWIETYINNYKQRNIDKGKFLDLLRALQ